MNIEEILESIDAMLDDGLVVPLSKGKIMVDADKIKQLLQDARMNLPREFSEAKRVVHDRASIISRAHEEAGDIVKRAEVQAKNMVASQQITQQAEQRAHQIVAKGQEQYRRLAGETQHMLDEILSKNEEIMTRHLMEVRSARAALKGQGKKG